jgi:uncharacterized membrane protein required for colicin V production
MAIDLLLAALVILFGVFGFLTGAISQITHWVGLICAYVGSHRLAALASPHINAKSLGMTPAYAQIALGALFFGLIYVAIAWILNSLLTKLLTGKRTSWIDKALGFGLGAGKAAVILFALLSGIFLFEKKIASVAALPEALDESRAIRYVRKNNLFARASLPQLKDLDRYISASDAEGLKAALTDPKLKELLRSEKLKKLAEDPSSLASVFGDPKMAENFKKLVEQSQKQAEKEK